MDSFKALLIMLTITLLGCFLCAIDYYMQSNTYQEKAYNDAVIAFNSAESIKDRLQVVGIMHNLEKQAFHGVMVKHIEKEYNCIYKLSAKMPIETKYNTIFLECLENE